MKNSFSASKNFKKINSEIVHESISITNIIWNERGTLR